jgi:predicted Zn finger-like uncharacterized protein
MRLTCPHCHAEYEVAATMLAAGGQHVQCTACHTRWFFRPPEPEPSRRLSEDDIIARLETRPRPRAVPGHAPVRAAPGAAARRRGGSDFAWTGPGDAAADRPHLRLIETPRDAPSAEAEPPADPAPPTSEATPVTGEGADAVATRPVPEPAPEAPPRNDARAAAAQAGRPASLDVAAPEAAPDPAPEHAAASDTAAALPRERPAARPRLELDPSRPESPAPPPAPPRSRFARGLAIGLAAIGLLAAAYLFAEEIARTVPEARPAVGAYTNAIDNGRIWAEARVAPLVERLREALGAP